MRKLATLFTDSYNEFRHVRTLTVAGMFGAISVVLQVFTIDVGDYLKIGFSGLANQFVYYLFGPVVGGAYGGAMDIIKYVAKPTGPYFPGWTIGALVAGVIYGSFLYKRPIRLARVLAAEFLVAVICNMLLGTWWLKLMYGYGFLTLLPTRVIKNLIKWPVDALLFYTIAKTMEAAGIFRILKDPFGKKQAQNG